jgi:hypothetical protein
MKLLINHIGYERTGEKKAIMEAPPDLPLDYFSVIERGSNNKVYEGRIAPALAVPGWKNLYFCLMDFTALNKNGIFFIQISSDTLNIISQDFMIKEHLYLTETLPDVLEYFTLVRCKGIFNEADYSIPFFGKREGRVDVHGGWYDASGDMSKYLSHLSYTNYFNPQQTPLVVWNLLFSYSLIIRDKNIDGNNFKQKILDEAVYGADFLMRMQDKDGYFYMTVFDGWSRDIKKREICSYATSKGIKSEAYQAGYRQGGGMAIAALALMSTFNKTADYDTQAYRETAVKGFYHLEENNLKYLNDGRENIIDDYCALLAATELFKACKDEYFFKAARIRVKKLLDRISSDENYSGFWRADEYGARPYFHAVEAGLPLISLIRFFEIEKNVDMRDLILLGIRKSLEFELRITNETANPFGYARQYIKPLNKAKRSAFFFPHENESGYWWQGENARLASLAAACGLAGKYFKEDYNFYQKLKKYTQDQIDWILGLNPFDMCMLQGKGRNNPEYMKEYFLNVRGGICNGITSGFYDEDGIEFFPEEFTLNISENWRWSEQWLPHAAWYFLAVSANM